MTTWTYTLAELQRRPGRALLTLAGVAIGVAILVAAGAAVEAARSAYRDLFDAAGNRESLEIVASGSAGFDGSFAANLTSCPGVRAVRPRVVVTTALADFSGGAPALVFGLEPTNVAEHPLFTLRSGQPFGIGEGIWLDAHTAEKHGWTVGAAITIWTPFGEFALPLEGIVEPRGSIGVTNSSVVYLPLTTAQQMFDLPGHVNSVEIVLADGSEPEEVKRNVALWLPGGLIVQASSRRGELSRSTLRAVEHGLTALSLIAMVAAGFVVLNTVLLNLTERRKQLALLRALGASRKQVRGLLMREAILLGMAGSIIGSAAGLLLAVGLANALQGFLGVSLPRPKTPPCLIGMAILAGPGVTALATFAACRKNESPLLDLVRPTGGSGEAWTGRSYISGLFFIGSATIVIVGLCLGWWKEPFASHLMAPAVAVLLAGCALCLPLLVIPVLRFASEFPRRLFGISGKLAICQLLRRPARTGLTSGVLFIAIASAVGFGHWLLNTLHDLKQWYGNAIVADFLIRGSVPDSSFLVTAPLPESLADELAGYPEVDRLDKVAFLPAEINGRSTLVLARTFAPDRRLTMDLRDGNPDDVRRGLFRGEAVLGAVLAKHLDVRQGDTVKLATPGGEVSLRITGIVTEYAAGGDAIYMEWDSAKKLLATSGVHVFLVTCRSGMDEALALKLQVFCYQHKLMFQSNADMRGTIDRLLDRITGSLWVIVTLTFAVASLGVVNTLTMNVIEQARDLGVMRAVGITTSQTRRLVLSQAFLLGAVSIVFGAAAGIGFAAIINETSNAVFGQRVAFSIEFVLTGGCVVVGIAITTLAAMLPANRAIRYSAMERGEKG